MDYKDLNINRETLDSQISNFIDANSFQLLDNSLTKQGKRIVFLKTGEQQATVDLYFTKSGSTTIQYKTGKNQDLGLKLAQYLYEQVQEREIKSVAFSINGISHDDIAAVVDELKTIGQPTPDFQITESSKTQQVIYTIVSTKYSDSLTVTHYASSNRLLIQGRPLYSYRKFVYLLTHLLSLEGLTSVIHRKDADDTGKLIPIADSSKQVEAQLPDAYTRLPEKIKSSLISGNCIKASQPKLLDYSVLLYTDLRSLEGVLRSTLSSYGLAISQYEEGFGAIFDEKSFIRPEHQASIICGPKMIEALQEGYSFFRKNRHGLFHMSDIPDASRVIDTLDKALSLCGDAYQHINCLYKFRINI